MKKNILFFLLLFFVFISCKNKTKYTSPTEYNNDIVEIQENLYTAVDSLENLLTANDIDIDAINLAYENVKKVSKESLEKINNISPYQNEVDFYQASKGLFTAFDNLLTDKYLILIKYLNKPIEEWTDEDFGNYYDTWDKIEDKIIKKENIYFDAQEKFAKENNLDLE